MAKVPVAVKEAVKVDNNTQIPKPKGKDALEKFHKGEPVQKAPVAPEAPPVQAAPPVQPAPAPKPQAEVIPASRPVGDDTVMVTCKENGHYRFGARWLVLLKGKKVSLPLEAAKEYKAKGKVDY